jgi:hypothetical protein
MSKSRDAYAIDNPDVWPLEPGGHRALPPARRSQCGLKR